jgi:glycosyltransferase involved in cell wall biosynthesis
LAIVAGDGGDSRRWETSERDGTLDRDADQPQGLFRRDGGRARRVRMSKAQGATLPAVLQVHAFHRDTTGADRYFRDVSTLLAAHGHRVAPFCARHAGDEQSEYGRYFPEGSLSAPNDSPGPLRALRDAAKFVYHWDARRRAAEIVRDFAPDVVHAHNLYHHLSPAVLPALRARGARVVMTLHDYKLICPNYSLYTQGAVCTACRGGRFSMAVVKRCVRDSVLKSALCAVEGAVHWRLGLYVDGVDQFLAPSRFVAEQFVAFGFPADKLRVLPNFTTLDVATEAPEDGSVLFAGRLVEVKGVLTLLAAWRASRARRQLRLAIAGDGPLRPSVERFVAENGLTEVQMLGSLSRADLDRRMAAATVVVVPSQWYEPFSLVVLEAQARARCVVASATGGIPELVEDGVTGLLVPPADERALAAAIDRAVGDPTLRAALGRAARRAAQERHGAEAHYRALLSAYRGNEPTKKPNDAV